MLNTREQKEVKKRNKMEAFIQVNSEREGKEI